MTFQRIHKVKNQFKLKQLNRAVIAALALPLFLHTGILSSLAVVSLIIATETPAMANGEIDIDSLVKSLTESDPGSKEFKKATEDAKKLTDEQAAQVAQKIVQKITGDAAQSVNTLLNLYQLGLKAGKNPLLAALGKPLSDAINKAFGNLVKVLNDPRTVGGKQKLIDVLTAEPFNLDLNGAFDIIDKLEKQAQKLEDAQKAKGKEARSRSRDSLSFDATTSILSFTDDLIVEIINEDSTVDLSDSIVGAEVVVPDFTFNGITPEGEPGFKNLSEDPIIIRKNSDVFLETVVPYFIWNGSQLFGFGGDLVLSGAPDGSAFDGGLPDLGSDYIDDLISLLTPLDFKNFFTFRIAPDTDLVQLTENFTKSGSTGFTNGAGLTQEKIPEPSSVLGLLALGTLGAASTLKRKLKPSKSTEKETIKVS